MQQSRPRLSVRVPLQQFGRLAARCEFRFIQSAGRLHGYSNVEIHLRFQSTVPADCLGGQIEVLDLNAGTSKTIMSCTGNVNFAEAGGSASGFYFLVDDQSRRRRITISMLRSTRNESGRYRWCFNLLERGMKCKEVQGCQRNTASDRDADPAASNSSC